MKTTPTNLWRGVREEEYPEVIVNGGPASDILYPDFERRQTGTMRDGRPKYREPDVRMKDGMIQPGGGTSLFDKDRFFKSKSWRYFYIPKGTEVDPTLKITGPTWNEFIGANHYQIEVDKPIPVTAYKGALDNLARAAVKKAYEDARR